MTENRYFYSGLRMFGIRPIMSAVLSRLIDGVRADLTGHRRMQNDYLSFINMLVFTHEKYLKLI